MKHKLSLTSKFFISSLLVGIVIASATAFTTAKLSIEASIHQAQDSLGVISDSSVETVSEFLKSKTKLAKVAASNKQIILYLNSKTESDRLLAAQSLVNQKKIDDDLEDILLVDIHSGVVLVDGTNGNHIGADETGFDFWEHRDSHSGYIDRTINISSSTGKYFFAVTAPVTDSTGSITGLIVLKLDWSKFCDQEFKDITIGQSGYMYIISPEGLVLYHPKDESLILNENEINDFIRTAVQEKNVFQKYVFNGEKKYLDASEVLESGWIICASVAESELIKGSLHAVYVSIAAAVSILLASSIIVFFIARGISKPVIRFAGNLAESSTQISTASIQLSSASQEIANGASEQASQIEETTSAMEELSSIVKINAENSKQASLLAEKSSDSAKEGFDQMTQLVESMMAISKSTDSIQNIIDVIDEIAFQTNMLALNASVEAARAGEAGLGFAVVADEVKNLANRSAQSAKETAELIKESLQRIEAGVEASQNLSDKFNEILNQSQKVNEMMKEIETASHQQNVGIEQVNSAIIQFDTVVQNNASNAEETASSAEEMQSQVDTVNSIANNLYVIVTGRNNNLTATEYGTKTQSGKALEYHNYNQQNTVKLYNPSSNNSTKDKHITTAGSANASRKISFEEDEEFTLS